ncbi:MAG: hypothetical protein HY741_18360 [Chloroflexi bacterium]|nr:hypothetical protein [Chloroflexota bacterium]
MVASIFETDAGVVVGANVNVAVGGPSAVVACAGEVVIAVGSGVAERAGKVACGLATGVAARAAVIGATAALVCLMGDGAEI